MSIFAYWFMPINTPDANDIFPEISTLSPGSEVFFLEKRKAINNEKSTFGEGYFIGKTNDYEQVPVKNITQKQNILTYQTYTDDKTYTITLSDSVKIVSQKYWLGADRFGRDMLSRMILGSRMSLSVGFISVFISLLVGVWLGALAGYFGGKTDILISWFINVIWALPSLLLVVAITFALGKGFWQIFIAIGLSTWVEVARMVRGQVMQNANLQYVEAGRALGYSSMRIIFKHILPNIVGPITVVASANFASAILLEAGLSFLGFGIQPPTPSWGGMVREHYSYIMIDKAYLAIAPGLAIMLLVFSFNILSIHFKNRFEK